ncbi:MAG: zinc-dependent metalloprotease [Candidatus Solibacter usitatus]|nr:zinc-dependent metalloprotease [Candidatus Solibacter usitatus]
MRFPLLALSLCFGFAAFSQDTPPATGGGPGGGGGGGGRTQEPDPRPYEKVITKEATSQPGIFTVHKLKNRYFYEIPAAELGKEFLWVTQIAKTTLGVGYGGQSVNNRVVRWERYGNRVLLRSIVYDVVADPKEPIAKAVQAANTDAILSAFNIEAFGKGDAPVIEVTRLFVTDTPELSARTRLRARSLDTGRSFLERISPYPTNIEVEATHTYTASTDTPAPGGAPAPTPAPGGRFGGSGMRGSSATVLMHYSMVKLPEKPMIPRLYDPRVGYFSISQTDYGRNENKAATRQYITRWRLEKKDPSAALSEPIKPIVYYIDPATPAKWIPYIKKGVELWQPAFEAAGFKNAILAAEAPKNDPHWAAEDARYSVIRWLPSNIENASGPHIHDPRTGEILESDIQFYHNVQKLVEDWYFTQASPNDKRAQKLPLPDDLMGELLGYVVTHEVGHTLGFQHNMKASSTYPVEKLRDREWLKKMSHTPTLMDYSRFNYLVQPEDKIDPKDLIPKIGPYDTWATMWGYKPIPGAKTSDDEKKTLDEWARAQDEKPYLRFSVENANGADPGENTEAVGDADAVKATALGMKNIERVMGYLLSAVTKDGEDWDDLDRTYGRVLGQWSTELNHVTRIVGGYDSVQRHGGQKGTRFSPVTRERQAEAVKFLNENAFTTPAMFFKPEILQRIEPSGSLDRIKTAQMRILTTLLAAQRLQRLVEQEASGGAKSYRPVDFLADLRKGVWKEIFNGDVKVDAARRNLQRGYLDTLAERLNGPSKANDDQRPLLRAELKKLSVEVSGAAGKASDGATRAHLDDVKDLIARILDPKIQWTAPSSGATTTFRRGIDDCWLDYGIYSSHQTEQE